jgi:hypothetical protein
MHHGQQELDELILPDRILITNIIQATVRLLKCVSMWSKRGKLCKSQNPDYAMQILKASAASAQPC